MSGKDCTSECDENATEFPDRRESIEGEISPEDLAKLMEKVADNYLVMKNIFGYLSSYDLWLCSGVNRFWKSIVESMKIWYYQIEATWDLPEEYQDSTAITLSKVYANNHKLISSSVQTLSSAKEFIQTIPQDFEIRLVEKSFNGKHESSSVYQNFLSEIGKTVTDRHLIMEITVHDLCLESSFKFPNLRKLDLTNTFFCSGNEDCTPAGTMQLLENLREITMSHFPCLSNSVVQLMNAAPNLIAIYDFDVNLVEALATTGRVGLVKSLGPYRNLQRYSNNPEVTYESAIRSLSQLKTTLRTLDLVTKNVGPDVFDSYLRIIQSSYESLVHMRIRHSRNPMNFQAVPPLISLKSIIFESESTSGGERYFSEGTRPDQLFPSLTHIAIQGIRYSLIHEPVFQDPCWGLMIKSITLQSYGAFNFSRDHFPNLISMEFDRAFSSDEFKSVLSDIATSWPHMEHISVCVKSPFVIMIDGNGDCSIDSAITGFSDEVLNQLKHPAARESIPRIVMQDLELSSTFRKLSKLKSLKIKMTGCTLQFQDKPLISELSHQFGFRFLPDMKLIIATDEKHRGPWIKVLKATLQPLMHLEIQIGKNNEEE